MYPDKIFVTHHSPLTERKQKLTDDLKEISNNVEIIWVEKYLPDEIRDDLKEIHDNFKQIKEPYVIEHPYGEYSAYYKKITISEYSLYLKHLYCLNYMKTNNLDNILVLEDDVSLPTHFDNFLQKNMTEFLEMNCDMLIMGESHGRRVKDVIPNKYVYYDKLYKTRCAHAIVYTKNNIDIILDELNNIDNPYDFKLDKIIMDKKLKVCWSYPGLKQGNYLSSLSR